MTPADEPRPAGEYGLQDYLSFGYLYLLLLGIVSESIYYGLLGVSVLSYSDVLDVLLSPLTQLENEPALFSARARWPPSGRRWWCIMQRRRHRRLLDRQPRTARSMAPMGWRGSRVSWR